MDVACPKFFAKIRAPPPVQSKKISCSSGWLRLVVQSIFAVITVVSFILIVVMAARNPHPTPGLRPPVPSRCHIQSCSVICNEAPYFDRYEEDIFHAVLKADSNCNRVYLELKKPSFTNYTLPNTWLSRLPNEVHQLSIIGGNLMHIPSGAFMGQFMSSVTSLALMNIRIMTFESNSLVGLSRLRTLNIQYCRILGMHKNALKAVDDTLETLTISKSRDWDPVDFTGATEFEQLTIVDFSNSDFDDILNRRSFIGLKATKILYLNYCRITAISEGTFDHLISIEVLYLNNNMLSTVPSGLFKTIVTLEKPRPRINLQDNYWYCDCDVEDFRELIRKDLLLVEVKCTFPYRFASKTFTQFEYICNNETDTIYEFNTSSNARLDTNNELLDVDKNRYIPAPIYYINGNNSCDTNFRSNLFKSITPVDCNKCFSKNFKSVNLSKLVDRNLGSVTKNKNEWFRFSYYIKTNLFSIIQIEAIKKHMDYGLIWFKSTCPHEIYCIDAIPCVFNLYDSDSDARYVFCPVHMKNGSLKYDDCIDFSMDRHSIYHNIEDTIHFSVILYVLTALLCSCFGAVAVYELIRRNPTLLKGSKRILFVKHKNVEALVLPPKIPLSNDFLNPKDKEVFILPDHNEKLELPNVKRLKSIRSNKSGTPSYISAMQPTEAQLAEWRIRNHFDKDLTITSRKSALSALSALSPIDTTYCSLEDGDRTYESLK